MGLYDVEQRVMYEIFSKMDPGAFVGLVALVGGQVCLLVAIVMGIVMRNRRDLAELAVAFKKEMLERGMTPEEIRIVMEAGSKNSQRLLKSPVEAEV
jgi:hypothetical protein